MGIGHTLKKIREKHGLTQEQFADKIDVKRTTYISYEKSKTTPGFKVIEKIVEVFGVSLLDFSEDETVEETEKTWLELHAPEPVFNPGTKREPKKLSGDEDMIINYYRLLKKEDKAEFFEKIKDAYLDILCGTDKE